MSILIVMTVYEELERSWKTWSWPVLSNIHNVCLERLWKIVKNLRFEAGTVKYEAKLLTNRRSDMDHRQWKTRTLICGCVANWEADHKITVLQGQFSIKRLESLKMCIL